MIHPKVKTRATGEARRKALEKALKKTRGAYVTVGVHEDAGEYDSGVSVAEVAAWNEFGTQDGHVPERSFMRSAIHDNGRLISEWRAEALEKIAFDGWKVEKALEMMGLRIQILVQNKIKSNIPPPNAPSTVARKLRHGAAPRTLIDTTLLLRSIGYEVVVGGEGGGEGGGHE